MKSKLITVGFALCLPLFVACQKAMDTTAPQSGSDTTAAVVKAANGKMYAVTCLREYASTIEKNGPSALSPCEVDPSNPTAEQKGKYFSSGRGCAIYYPPYYYNPAYVSPYSYANNFNGNYGGGTYPTNYGYPYGTSYGSTGSGNLFCNYVFGTSFAYDCTSTIFGYSPSYSSYYQSGCNSCLTSFNPAQCQTGCYQQIYFH